METWMDSVATLLRSRTFYFPGSPKSLTTGPMNDPRISQVELNRRHFLQSTGVALSAAGLLALSNPNAATATSPKPKKLVSGRVKISKGSVVLFQGDSITDAARTREKVAKANDQGALGSGYAWLAAMELLLDNPEYGLKIYNRGVSGHKVYQLAERWEEDTLKLQPNLLSILIGVNDYWHTLTGGYKGTLEVYTKDFRALVERTLTALPNVGLVICEPFALRTGAVNDKWFPEFDKYRAAARRVAEEYKATFVPFQLMFDRAIKYAPAEHWAKDGVHPTSAGAALMAHTWLKAVTES